MAYATVQDMIGRFGETEMLRLSSVDGVLPETVQAAPVEQAIADADGIIDSYLRKRSQLAICCHLIVRSVPFDYSRYSPHARQTLFAVERRVPRRGEAVDLALPDLRGVVEPADLLALVRHPPLDEVGAGITGFAQVALEPAGVPSDRGIAESVIVENEPILLDPQESVRDVLR